MKRVLVTGVSGLLGTNLAGELLAEGYSVRGLVRDISRYRGVRSNHLELVKGDILDDLTDVCQGCDYVVHAAAETRQDIPCYDHYRRINFTASARLFDTAVRCGVKRFIFVSTVNTLGYGSSDNPGNEDNKIKAPFSFSLYARSKLEAEKYLIENSRGTEVVIVNPSFMLGPYGTGRGPEKIISWGWRRKVIFYPPGGRNFVHVKDVSRGIIRCIDHGLNGEKYMLAHENISYLGFFRRLNKITGQDPVMIPVPGLLLVTLGYAGNILRFMGIRTSVSSVNMKILCLKNYYSNRKSVQKLKMDYLSTDEAIRDTVRYLQDDIVYPVI
jgi:dihydroflavonol-4-reductase